MLAARYWEPGGRLNWHVSYDMNDWAYIDDSPPQSHPMRAREHTLRLLVLKDSGTYIANGRVSPH